MIASADKMMSPPAAASEPAGRFYRVLLTTKIAPASRTWQYATRSRDRELQ